MTEETSKIDFTGILPIAVDPIEAYGYMAYLEFETEIGMTTQHQFTMSTLDESVQGTLHPTEVNVDVMVRQLTEDWTEKELYVILFTANYLDSEGKLINSLTSRMSTCIFMKDELDLCTGCVSTFASSEVLCELFCVLDLASPSGLMLSKAAQEFTKKEMGLRRGEFEATFNITAIPHRSNHDVG